MRYLLILVLSLTCFVQYTHGQSILYGYPSISGGGFGQIVSIDLVTCQETIITDNMPTGNFTDFVLMPNGVIYLLGFTAAGSSFVNAVLIHDPVTGTNTVASTLAGIPLGGSMLGLNDSIILITTLDLVHSFNINTNMATVLGNIPGFSGFGESFLYNGQIYITQSNGGNYPNGTYILNLSTLSLTPAPFNGALFVGVCNQLFSPDQGFQEYNPSNGTFNLLCLNFISGGGGGFLSTAVDPFNTTGPLCSCTTESGIWNSGASTFLVQCSTNPFLLPTPTGSVLDGNDNLVYVLTDGYIYNSSTNILQTYPTSTIGFIPGVTQFNQNYYVYLVAADAVGTGVSLTDPCRDINETVFVLNWRSAPTVAFASSTTVCSGTCQTIDALFTGQPPYNITYQTLTNGVVSGTFTGVFNSNTATIQACPPVGFAGTFEVKATNLVDANCTCGQ